MLKNNERYTFPRLLFILRCYYFEVDALKKLFVDAGFEAIECKYVQRQTVNKKEDVSVPRVFVQAQFLKR